MGYPSNSDSALEAVAGEIKQFVERYEQLEAEEKEVRDQKRELMAEAKGRGFDTKVMKLVVKRRKRTPDEIAEEEAILEMYENALLV